MAAILSPWKQKRRKMICWWLKVKFSWRFQSWFSDVMERNKLPIIRQNSGLAMSKGQSRPSLLDDKSLSQMMNRTQNLILSQGIKFVIGSCCVQGGHLPTRGCGDRNFQDLPGWSLNPKQGVKNPNLGMVPEIWQHLWLCKLSHFKLKLCQFTTQ